MAKNLRDFIKNNNGNISKQDYEKIKNNFSDEQIDDVQKFASRYEGASQQEMLQDIVKMASSARANGELDDGDIDAFVQNISPMLDASQKNDLAVIVRNLKSKR